jgi:hypothetical protein
MTKVVSSSNQFNFRSRSVSQDVTHNPLGNRLSSTTISDEHHSPAISSSRATSTFGVQRRFNGSSSSGSSGGMRRKTVGPSILDETFEEEPESEKRVRANRMLGGARKQIVSRNPSGRSDEHLSTTPSLQLQPNLLQPKNSDLK